MKKTPNFPLKQLQSWMQACLVQPVDPSLRGHHGPVSVEEVEALIAPSKRMSAQQRLAIYQRGYFARLQECMSKQFSVLRHALGEELFRDFAFDYLRLYPSTSYTLGELGARFPDFLESTRPDKDAAPEDRESWPDFMIELARLEWACFRLTEADGNQAGPVVLVEPEGAIAFHLPSAMRLFELRFPSYEYYQTVMREEAEAVFPAPERNFLLLVNRKHRIGAFTLSEIEYGLWQKFVAGKTQVEAFADLPEEHRRTWVEKWQGFGVL